MAKKIKIKVEITYEPRVDDYWIYDIEPTMLEQMAAQDVKLIRSGELTYGDFDDEAVVTSWEVVDDGSENS